MTALNKQALRSKARSASAGEWIKESGDGWEAICSSDDQANSGFIIAHLEGPDAKENREFIQAANPSTVLALLDELEKEKGYASTYEAEKWHYHGLAESEGERADRAEKALEARNGEQLLRSLTLVLRQYNDYGQISLEAIEEAEFEIKTAIAAGIGVKGE
ncbi:ead/Ea22-like family protein [Citrobacter braakii]|uniref:ead/Ea22-like family protein n=1 Tax=Citrobacter braakii TaxID=57706 RepID=UPI00103937A8|nr:ead/Ea22-like family protein [Citrobacter braakii]TCC61524.1 ead/Ea22-like family protein [Citrobacter braakii]